MLCNFCDKPLSNDLREKIEHVAGCLIYHCKEAQIAHGDFLSLISSFNDGAPRKKRKVESSDESALVFLLDLLVYSQCYCIIKLEFFYFTDSSSSMLFSIPPAMVSPCLFSYK